MLFDCERSFSSPRRVSDFNGKEPQMGIYLHIKFERDRLNIFELVFTSSRTIISPNTSGPFDICHYFTQLTILFTYICNDRTGNQDVIMGYSVACM